MSLYDSVQQDGPDTISIQDKELSRQLQLTTEDLRFADSLCKRVDDTVASGEFLETTGEKTPAPAFLSLFLTLPGHCIALLLTCTFTCMYVYIHTCIRL